MAKRVSVSEKAISSSGSEQIDWLLKGSDRKSDLPDKSTDKDKEEELVGDRFDANAMEIANWIKADFMN